jgi:transposase
VQRLRVAHSAAGLAELTAALHALSEEPGQVLCVVETSDGLLVTALLEAGLVVCPVNAAAAQRLRPLSGAKTDALDALLLARLGRTDWPRVRVLQPESPLVQELKALTRDLQGLIEEQTRLVNQLAACLHGYYPVALECFDGLARRVSLAFLQQFPTPEQAAQASVGQVHALLVEAHYPRSLQEIALKAQRLQAQLQAPQLRATPALSRAKSRLMLAIVAQLQVVGEHIVAYDQAVQRLFQQHPDYTLFVSLPGAGRRIAPRLLAEWGDEPERYASAADAQALAGTAPVVFQSGQYRGVRRRRACINPFRQALYHLAGESVILEPWAKTYYERKRAQGKTHAMALRALGNIWVRILYALWRQKTLYSSAIFTASQQAHGAAA